MQTQQKTILIVEDEDPIRKALQEKLAREGFRVITASEGKQGLDTALTEKPDIILLDIVMPIMDGLSMLEKLRKDEWGKDVPVIMLTNLSDSDKIAQSTEKGVYDYLVKSDWKIEDVVTKVKEKLT
jgi:DNA-binding response OmpR family regulator